MLAPTQLSSVAQIPDQPAFQELGCQLLSVNQALQRFEAFEKFWRGREGIVSHPNIFERDYPWIRFEWGCVVESEMRRAVFGWKELEETDG